MKIQVTLSRNAKRAISAKKNLEFFAFHNGPIRGKNMRRLKKWCAVFNKLARGMMK